MSDNDISKFKQDVTEVFDLEIVKDNPKELTSTSPSKKTTNNSMIVAVDKKLVENDFITARENIKELIDSGTNLYILAERVALEQESGRSIEVAASLIKALISANKDLMDIHKTKKDIIHIEDTREKGSNINVEQGIVFNGSTADLQKILSNKKED